MTKTLGVRKAQSKVNANMQIKFGEFWGIIENSQNSACAMGANIRVIFSGFAHIQSNQRKF